MTTRGADRELVDRFIERWRESGAAERANHQLSISGLCDVLVVDVGHSIELFSEFTRSGGTYVPFPAPGSHRVFLEDLANPEVRDRLRSVWTDPMSLDPTRRSARVTRETAERLARLMVTPESKEHDPGQAREVEPWKYTP
jgi:hypothetical protein